MYSLKKNPILVTQIFVFKIVVTSTKSFENIDVPNSKFKRVTYSLLKIFLY